jgi:hypothetical protein
MKEDFEGNAGDEHLCEVRSVAGRIVLKNSSERKRIQSTFAEIIPTKAPQGKIKFPRHAVR